jgi:hypothetical protein
VFSTALHKLHGLIRLTFALLKFVPFTKCFSSHPSVELKISDLHNDWLDSLILSNPVWQQTHREVHEVFASPHCAHFQDFFRPFFSLLLLFLHKHTKGQVRFLLMFYP